MLAGLFYLLLLLALIVGLATLVVNLPGLWIMVLAAVIYAALTAIALGLVTLTLKLVLWMFALALIAEVIDFFAAGAGAKRAGGTRRGMWGAIIGGIVGAIVGSFVLPLIATLVGVCIGTFLGAFIGELSGGKEISQSARIGVLATIGRLTGTLLKMIFGCVMLTVIMWHAWPWGKARGAAVRLSPPARVIVAPPATSQAS
jgi:uncharacterized protein YqgC (DUF456 family)